VATHQKLEDMVQAGRFREDLYYRLNVVSIALPPLRDRREDIPVLLDHFLKRSSQESGTPPPRLSAEAMTRLLEYGWPGNVRELMNVIEHAVLLSGEGLITLDALPERLRDTGSAASTRARDDLATLDAVPARHAA